MSYIDREALIERLCYVCGGVDCDKNICPVTQTVEYMPDADVEPIRHGEWIYDEAYEMFTCSVCGKQMIRNDYPYCAFCGAKMDKGET